MPRAVSERGLVFLVGAVQCVNILDFVIVSPLAPDFARDLHIPPEHIGFITGSYTAAAAVAGLVGSLFLERFDRKRALLVAMFGLTCGTFACAAADSFAGLVAARVLAGIFGGPATSIAFAIVADAVSEERRGKAMGAVMGAFSVASIAGVPAGLELARVSGWQATFIAVGATSLLVTTFVAFAMQPMRGHLARRAQMAAGYRDLFASPSVVLSYAMTAMLMVAGFAVIVNLPAFVQLNLGYPRWRFALLYLAGGVVSFVSMRVAGRLIDRFGSFSIGAAGSCLFATIVFVYFGVQLRAPAEVLFVVFMASMALRNVAMQTLNSKVPLPHQRARFLSLLSTVSHTSSSAGAFLAARLLTTGEDGALSGLERIAALSIGLTLLAPLVMRVVERHVRSRAAQPVVGAPLA